MDDERHLERRVVVRWGRRLTHIEAHDADDAVHGSIEAFNSMGEGTKDASALHAFSYVEYRYSTQPGDFTRAVIDHTRRHHGPHRPRGHKRPGR